MRWLRIIPWMLVWVGPAVPAWCVETPEPTRLFLDEPHLAVSLSFTAHDLVLEGLDKTLLEQAQTPKEDLFSLRPDDILLTGAVEGKQLQSVMPVSPWLKTLDWPPVLLIHPQIQKGLDVKEWRFAVMDGARHVLYDLQGKGSMPETVVWDGRNQKNEMVEVGLDFFYTLGAIDNGGNPIFMTSPAQQLRAFAFIEHQQLFVRLQEALLFRPGKNVVLSEEGELALKECADEVAKRPSPSLVITAVSRDAKLAELQAQAVANYFLHQLTLSPAQVAVKSEVGRERFKVEIMCK